MKWNWGTKLALIFGFFVAAMIFLVVLSMRQKIQLVATDYYNEELRYQQVIDASQLANELSGKVVLSRQGNHIQLQLPAEMQGAVVTGEVVFYCVSEAANDRTVKLATAESGIQLIPVETFQPGSYTVKVKWLHNSKQYYSEQQLIL